MFDAAPHSWERVAFDVDLRGSSPGHKTGTKYERSSADPFFWKHLVQVST